MDDIEFTKTGSGPTADQKLNRLKCACFAALHLCVYETLDAGAFYSSGQQGTAFVNRGNVIRGNNFTGILNHAEGKGVQSASVQAVKQLKDITF